MSAAIKPFHFLPGNCQERLLLCDHASCEIPVELAELGLSQTDRRRHIAWDIGAKEVAWALAEKLDCPAFFGGVSRLVADLNRAPDSAEMVMRESDGSIVPGNCSLSDEARGQRISQWHAPYHHAIAHHLQTCLGRGCRPIILSIHSFNPELHGQPRPWPVGLLWREKAPWLEALFNQLRQQGLNVGDNQPYDGWRSLGYTLEQHAIAHGLRYLMVEIRNDQIATVQGQRAWAQTLHWALDSAGFWDAR